MSVEDLKSVEGFQEKSAKKIHDGIKAKLAEASLVTIMAATNIFGRGFSDKKIELIMDAYPYVFNPQISTQEKIKKISEIKGMALKTAESFVAKTDDFEDFLMETDLFYKLIEFEKINKDAKKEIDSNNPLYGKTIVMTGFRDDMLEKNLKLMGAKVSSNVSKNTSIVVAKNKNDDSSKIVEANKLGIQVLSLEEFKTTYHL
jgi:NAD-dependent DNA ligase